MKNYILLFVLVFSSAVAKAIAPQQLTITYQHMLEVNKEWRKHKNALNGTTPLAYFTTDVKRIKQHLLLVHEALSKADTKHLDEKQSANRHAMLATLLDYANDGIFPMNIYHAERTPYFIDHRNVACAVGHLIRESGHTELTAKIEKENNYAYLPDLAMKYKGVNEWALAYGFTLDELAWVQPGYTCGSIGGDFTTLIIYQDTVPTLIATYFDPDEYDTFSNLILYYDTFNTSNGILILEYLYEITISGTDTISYPYFEYANYFYLPNAGATNGTVYEHSINITDGIENTYTMTLIYNDTIAQPSIINDYYGQTLVCDDAGAYVFENAFISPIINDTDDCYSIVGIPDTGQVLFADNGSMFVYLHAGGYFLAMPYNGVDTLIGSIDYANDDSLKFTFDYSVVNCAGDTQTATIYLNTFTKLELVAINNFTLSMQNDCERVIASFGTTTNTINNIFTLQYSNDAVKYTNVCNTTQNEFSCSLTQSERLGYYRIKKTTESGEVSYSKIATVHNTCNQWSVANVGNTLQVLNASDQVNVRVFSSTGAMVLNATTQNTIDLSHLPTGLYTYIAKSNNEQQTGRVLVK